MLTLFTIYSLSPFGWIANMLRFIYSLPLAVVLYIKCVCVAVVWAELRMISAHGKCLVWVIYLCENGLSLSYSLFSVSFTISRVVTHSHHPTTTLWFQCVCVCGWVWWFNWQFVKRGLLLRFLLLFSLLWTYRKVCVLNLLFYEMKYWLFIYVCKNFINK